MESTAKNMWKAVFSSQCAVIVMLSILIEGGMASLHSCI